MLALFGQKLSPALCLYVHVGRALRGRVNVESWQSPCELSLPLPVISAGLFRCEGNRLLRRGKQQSRIVESYS